MRLKVNGIEGVDLFQLAQERDLIKRGTFRQLNKYHFPMY